MRDTTFNDTVGYLPNHITLEEVLDDNRTLATRDGTLVQVIKLVGKDYTSMAKKEQEELHDQRVSLFSALAEDKKNVHITIHVHRKRTSLAKENAQYGNCYAEEIMSAYHEKLKHIYITETYLVVSLKNEPLIKSKVGIGSTSFAQEKNALEGACQELDNIVQKVKRFLNAYKPTVLEYDPENNSPLYAFWMYIINGGKDFTVPKQRAYLGKIFSLSSPYFSNKKKTITFTDEAEKDRYAAFFGLNFYPEKTHNTMLDELFSIQHPISVIQHVKAKDAENIRKSLEKQMRDLSVTRKYSSSRIKELEFAAEGVENNDFVFYDHTFSLCVYGQSKEHLESGIRDVQAILAQNGISIIRESANLHASFWGQFPGFEEIMDARKAPITTDNLSQFNPFSRANEGNQTCRFGDAPVCHFKKSDNAAFAFTFHSQENEGSSGHTMVIGGTGSGKTTLITFLLMNCLKFHQNDRPLKTLLFDSGKGTKIPTLAFGGEYIRVGEDTSLQLNPFSSLEDTPGNREFLEQFMGMLANGVSDKEHLIISEAVRQNYMLTQQDRALSSLGIVLGPKFIEGDNTSLSLFERLKKWMPAHNNGSADIRSSLFNSSVDLLNFTNRIVAFDMVQILSNPQLLAPLTAYIFHKFNNDINKSPCPHVIFIDESVQYLDNPLFGPHILKIIREQRKKNGVLIMAAQEAKVLTGSERGMAALANMDTYIIYQNTSASPEHYIDGLGLNDEEFKWVKADNGRNKNARQVLVRRKAGGSVILDVDLNILGKYLQIFSGSAKDVEVAEREIALSKEGWVERYINRY